MTNNSHKKEMSKLSLEEITKRNAAQIFITQGLGHCGCMDDEALEKTMLLLKAFHQKESTWIDKVSEIFSGNESWAFASVMLLEKPEWIEHGTSCCYSRATEEGKKALEAWEICGEYIEHFFPDEDE
jgi:hypothetical protein